MKSALAGVCFVALLFAMPTAWGGRAQAQSASERSLARQLFRQGVSSAREGDWEVACERFQRAYELDPRPVTLLNYAGALVQTGRLVEGAEGYRSFLAGDMTGSAERLRGDAERLLAEVEPRIPRLQLAILGIEATDVVRLDEWEISHAALELGLPVDPGEHVVQVSRGTDTRELAFSVAEGETEALEVDLRGVVSVRGADVDPDALRVSESDQASSGELVDSPVFWIITVAAVVVVGGLSIGLGVGLSSGQTAPLHEGNIPPFQLGLQ